MPKLSASLKSWNTALFAATLKHELESLPTGVLPLAEGTSQGGLVDDTDISVTVISVGEEGNAVKAKAGVFFGEVVGGCSCGDDPSVENAYCEIQLSIDTQTAETEFQLCATTR